MPTSTASKLGPIAANCAKELVTVEDDGKAPPMIPIIETHLAAVARREWIAGLKHGLWMYAHWRDGVELVGTCGTTLKDALAKAEAEWHAKHPGEIQT